MAGTLTVACKLPCGYLMEVFAMVDGKEPVMGGGWRETKVARRTGKRIRLNGFATPFNKAPRHDIVHGMGLTHGVDADLFNAWLADHKDDELVTNRIIFAFAKPADTEARAKELVAEKSGFESLDPKSMPPEFSGKIETAVT